VKEIIEKIRKKNKGERRKRIKKSRYNNSYKNVITSKLLPEYLKGKKKR